MKYTVSLPRGEVAADSYKELLERFKKERDFWTDFGTFNESDLNRSSGTFGWKKKHLAAANSLLIFWEEIVDEMEQLDGRTFADEFQNIRDNIEGSDRALPSSTSAVAQQMLRLRLNGDHEKAFAIFLGVNELPLSIERQLGNNANALIASYWGYAKGLTAAIDITDLNVLDDQVSAKIEQDLTVSREMFDSINTNLAQLEDERERLQKCATEAEIQMADRLKSLHSRGAKALRSLLKRARHAGASRADEFDSLLQTFEAHMRLQRPVSLWTERRQEHLDSAKFARNIFIAGSLAFAVAALVTLVCFGDWIANSFVKAGCVTGLEPFCDQISPKGPLAISMILAVATVWLWFLRLQMRIFLSERHLALDARERMAFAETYLSLLKGDSITTEHEAVVLQSLFRPTQDGIIKDDLGPDLTLGGLLVKTLDKQSK